MTATSTLARKRPRRVTGTALGPPVGPRRVAIYLRRSTDDEHQPFSIHAQETALTSYVKSQPGWTLTATYSDDASGATTGRPDLQRALRAAQAGRFDVLLVYRVDRFSRRLSDLLDLLADLDDAGVAFASATEPFDTSTSIGRMLVQLLGVFAEFERETIIDRVTSGMNTKAAKGKWAGGKRPYGYQLDPDAHKLVPNETEALYLRDIFTCYTRDRIGTRAIAARLNTRGISSGTGKPWSGHQIARILVNPAYAGDIARGTVYVPDAHPPLIDRNTFARAGDIAAARAAPHLQRSASPSDYQLTSLMTCPGCGCKYVGTAAHGRSGTYRYYTCFTRARYGTKTCPAPRIPADQADTAVLTALAAFYAQETALLTAAISRAQAHQADGHAGQRAEADAVTAHITAKEAAIARYRTAFENGTMDDTTAGPRLKELQQELTLLRARYGELTDAINAQPAPPPAAALDHLRGYLPQLVNSEGSATERKAAVEALIHEIRITEQGLIPVYRIPAPDSPVPGHDDTPPVRTMVGSVGRLGLEPTTGGLRGTAPSTLPALMSGNTPGRHTPHTKFVSSWSHETFHGSGTSQRELRHGT
jgi:site-specific DNA recombinase